MTTTTTATLPTAPLTHERAMALQSAELTVTLRLLQGLDADQWATNVPDCPAWDVRMMYLHVLGACEGAATRENLHQMRRAWLRRRREGGPLESNLSAVQVAERSALTPAELVERLTTAGPRAVRLRRRLPGLLRRISMQVDGPVVERWRLGYLVDTIYLRDLWMHRLDTCRALGIAAELTADHDGAIVADIVAEWARRHGKPFRLLLTGPAGGSFDAGDDGESYSLDALDFCRMVSGRLAPTGPLLATVIPF
jgi:uncharacterized protein (TIGR03083 family)